MRPPSPDPAAGAALGAPHEGFALRTRILRVPMPNCCHACLVAWARVYYRGRGGVASGGVAWGVELQRTLAKGLVVRAGYSHFFITKSAGSDVEMIVLAVSQQVALTDKNTLTGSFEFYQFIPTSSSGPAAGRFYLPSVTFSRSFGKWSGSVGLAGAFNSSGVFGFVAEPAVRVTGQLLFKFPKGQTGPDITYGGVPGSKQRPMRTTFGWSWVF